MLFMLFHRPAGSWL